MRLMQCVHSVKTCAIYRCLLYTYVYMTLIIVTVRSNLIGWSRQLTRCAADNPTEATPLSTPVTAQIGIASWPRLPLGATASDSPPLTLSETPLALHLANLGGVWQGRQLRRTQIDSLPGTNQSCCRCCCSPSFVVQLLITYANVAGFRKLRVRSAGSAFPSATYPRPNRLFVHTCNRLLLYLLLLPFSHVNSI